MTIARTSGFAVAASGLVAAFVLGYTAGPPGLEHLALLGAIVLGVVACTVGRAAILAAAAVLAAVSLVATDRPLQTWSSFGTSLGLLIFIEGLHLVLRARQWENNTAAVPGAAIAAIWIAIARTIAIASAIVLGLHAVATNVVATLPSPAVAHSVEARFAWILAAVGVWIVLLIWLLRAPSTPTREPGQRQALGRGASYAAE